MPFDINYEPIGSNGRLRARLSARHDGRLVHSDTLDLAIASSRNRFLREITARAPVAADEVERVMLELCDRQAQQPAAFSTARAAPDDPHRLAEACLTRHWRTEWVELRLAHYRDQFHQWDGTKYVPLGEKEFRSLVTDAVKDEVDRLAADNVTDGKGCTFKVTRQLVADVTQALAGIVQVPDSLDQPMWLDAVTRSWLKFTKPACNQLAVPGGLVDLVAYTRGYDFEHPPTPDFFTANGTDYPFDPSADCPNWRSFLSEIWPSDCQSIEVLQEYFGYLLLPDTSQQKILLLHGPKRSGRGTMMRVLRALVGTSNAVGPTLKSMQGEFGLEPLLGKLVAIINDARLSGRYDMSAIVENLLSISGEDSLTINRKNRSMVTTKLPTRVVIVTNELPNLRDASGALASRLLILKMTRSWFGTENTGLTEELLDELPGILNWAIEGLQRLRQRGYFVQPASAQDLVGEMERLSSPIAAFIADCCDVTPDGEIPRTLLYTAWCGWCVSNNITHPGTQANFGRDLRAVMPDLENGHPSIDERRTWCYRGITLRQRMGVAPTTVGVRPAQTP